MSMRAISPTFLLSILLLTLSIACSQLKTDHKKLILGDWEGRYRHNDKLVMLVTFTQDKVQITCCEDAMSTKTYGYKFVAEDKIKIDGIEEILNINWNASGAMSFGLDDAASKNLAVPVISGLEFLRK